MVHLELHGFCSEISKSPVIAGVVTDVTNRIENEKKLQQLHSATEANRAKNEFLSMAAHELRDPLNGISGFSQTLSYAYLHGTINQDTSMLPDILNRIYQSSLYMAALIEGLLEFSSIEAGNVEILYEAVDLSKALDMVQSNLAGKIQEGQLELKIQIQDELPSIHAGLKQLTQILFNIVGNAV